MKKLTKMVVAGTIAALAIAPHAAAHKVGGKPARKAAAIEARKAAESTKARSFEIRRCKRLTAHKWECQSVLHYRGGVTRCEIPITVSAKTHASRTLRRKLGEALCY